MKKDEVMQNIHEFELKIAREIKRICDVHNIKYFLIAGTLLGVVRHGGFIPWDDDMDIGMLREDYERFLEVCKEELSGEFYLQTWDTDPEYPFSFAKIRLNGTSFIESFSEKSNTHKGLFIDIFPFDNVPDDKIKRLIQEMEYFICKRLLWIKKGMGQNMKKTKLKALKYYLFKVFSVFFSYESVKLYYKKAQVRFNGKRTEKVVVDSPYSYKKESIPRVWMENLELVTFEGIKFYAFKQRENYLSQLYGDYMKLPPIEQRDRHIIVNIDFGDY